MAASTRIDLHCHSEFSDGALAPEALAEALAEAGVGYAALTDHNTVDGLPVFQTALRKRHIGAISGVEITVQCDGREAHLLGYGIDPSNPELKATLQSLRQVQELGVQSIAGSLRRIGAAAVAGQAAQSAAPDGRLEIGAGIELIHRAGGRAFLAHPFTAVTDPAALDDLVDRLKAAGLDGLEVFYAPYPDDQRARLEALARKHALLQCGGSDAHSAAAAEGVSMPTAVWKQFRDAVAAGMTSAGADPASGRRTPHQPPAGRSSPEAGAVPPPIYRRRYFVLRILLPTLLAIGLFVVTMWGMILPSFENTLLERKREMIRELTNSAWSILASYERDERAGALTRQEAQALAIARIEALRYGREGKDYFWLQDLHPRMIMHPYRQDLNGQDLSQFTDPRGVCIFVEFADLVRRQGEGYIEYVWQWKDDPQRLEAKESYVKGFEPWGWVIGTGIYIEDVKQEIARIERSLVLAATAISGGVVLLLAFVVQQSLSIEKQRREMERSLHESTERYRSLVEAATEGTLLVLDGRCRYANPTLLQLLGYRMTQLELLDLEDLLPQGKDNAAAWADIERLAGEAFEPVSLEGVLRRADGRPVECVLALNPIASGGLSGFILLVKETAPRLGQAGESGSLGTLAQDVPLGLFRARAARRGVITEMNTAARGLLARAGRPEADQPALADLFPDAAEYDEFFQRLQNQGAITDHCLHLKTIEAGPLAVSLTARLARGEYGRPDWVEGALVDVTAAQRDLAERDALIEKLQTSLLFLHQPVGSLNRHSVVCDLNTPIQKAAALMVAHNASAILVLSESGAAVGLVTDHDLRSRVFAGDQESGRSLDLRAPVHRIMSAPLVSIPEDALIYEALMRMEEQDVQHLAVEDETGRIVGVIRGKELVQFHRYGSIVLGREIARARTSEEVARCCERTPALVRALLDSGGRPHNITHMLSSVCDAAAERLLSLALGELGPPPTAFAFIAMGSQGRQEQTLLTDQDNAIIYAPPENADRQAEADDYFACLGARVCEGLDQAGYSRCRGQVMASNPRWRRSLPEWKAYFDGWIRKAEPQELLEFSIFFDFRPVLMGEENVQAVEMAQELRRHIHTVLDEQPAFFPHMAQSSLHFKPPTRLPGKIYLSGGEHAGQINLKDAMAPIVNFARLYALRHHVGQSNTLSRLDALVEKNVLLPASRDEIAAAYDFLMKLRLQRQLDALQAGDPADNVIQPARLGHIEEALLHQAFAQISAVQKKISYDFLGGM
jgi:PAS domain S-box-containing protein